MYCRMQMRVTNHALLQEAYHEQVANIMHRVHQFILLFGPFILVDGHRMKPFSAALGCNRKLTILA